jgi:hypothetical protein
LIALDGRTGLAQLPTQWKVAGSSATTNDKELKTKNCNAIREVRASWSPRAPAPAVFRKVVFFKIELVYKAVFKGSKSET